MNTQKALEVKKAIITLSDVLGIEAQDLVNSICLLDKRRYSILKTASDIWNTFDDLDIVERGKMIGLNISVS